MNIQHTLIAELLCGGYDEFREVAHDLDDRIFTDKTCELIYSAIKALAEEGQEYDSVAVSGKLSLMNRLDSIGGNKAIVEISGNAITAANIRTTTRQAIEAYYKDRLHSIGTRLAKASLNGVDVFELAEKTIAEMQKVLEQGQSDCTATITDAITKVEEEYQEMKAGNSGNMLPTGISSLDEKLGGGFRKGSFIVFGARPSTGKSNVAFNLIANMSDTCRIGLISAEMDLVSVTQRTLSSIGGFDDKKYSTGEMSADDIERHSYAKSKMVDRAVFINDTPNISIGYVDALAKKWKREHGIDILIIDYLQLLDCKQSRSRENEVSQISKTLKKISREVCTVIALAQLNRSVEGLPKLKDLRESGAIEQDADTVIMLHDFFADGKLTIPEGFGSYSGMASNELIAFLVEKNRRGQRKVMTFVHFNKTTGKMSSLTQTQVPQQQEKNSYVQTDDEPF